MRSSFALFGPISQRKNERGKDESEHQEGRRVTKKLVPKKLGHEQPKNSDGKICADRSGPDARSRVPVTDSKKIQSPDQPEQDAPCREPSSRLLPPWKEERSRQNLADSE